MKKNYSIFLIIISFLLAHLQILNSAIEESEKADGPKITKKTKKKKQRGKWEKIIPKKDLYKQKKDEKEFKSEPEKIEHEADISAIKKSASDDINSVLVILSEIPINGKNPVIAPIFVTEQKNVFGTGTDMNIEYVGFWISCMFTQKNFPWKKTTLQEVLIGSFLYASGTSLGFVNSSYQEETRFFTHYTSQILILKWNATKYISFGAGIGSRQYFFKEREAPPDFIMPKSHVNIFPRVILDIGDATVKGVDQLTHGIKYSFWAGYGIRSKWDAWGEPNDLQSSKDAKDFLIYSNTIKMGILFQNNHNLILRARFKGGVDNDFLSRPRFGATIDNVRLDVVHGFTYEKFRIDRFGLINLKYGFNIFSHLRFNLFFDYAHILAPYKEGNIGSGYGIRILAIYGLPIWFTHGLGKKVYPEPGPLQQAFMIMTAVGW